MREAGLSDIPQRHETMIREIPLKHWIVVSITTIIALSTVFGAAGVALSQMSETDSPDPQATITSDCADNVTVQVKTNSIDVTDGNFAVVYPDAQKDPELRQHGSDFRMYHLESRRIAEPGDDVLAIYVNNHQATVLDKHRICG